jgi:hypothetical protein
MLYPDILQYKDRARDDCTVVSDNSGLASFGGNRPEQLLTKSLANYATTLFRI